MIKEIGVKCNREQREKNIAPDAIFYTRMFDELVLDNDDINQYWHYHCSVLNIYVDFMDKKTKPHEGCLYRLEHLVGEQNG